MDKIFKKFEWKLNKGKRARRLAQVMARYVDMNIIHSRHNEQIKEAIKLAREDERKEIIEKIENIEFINIDGNTARRIILDELKKEVR